jgi:alkylated DNA nucleotide flippase Atl1
VSDITKKKKKKKNWGEKLGDSKGLPRVDRITDKMSKTCGTGTVVIPAPVEVDEMMRKVPEGKLLTTNQIRAALAKKHKATIGCPLTTGMFASIAAHAAEEQRAEGRKDVTPYWRVLKEGGVLNEKYPGGAEAQKKLLENEDHIVIQKGRKCVVSDFEKSLATI